MIDHNKYVNNYDYNKAVYLMSEEKFYDNGFFILKEEKKALPVTVLNPFAVCVTTSPL